MHALGAERQSRVHLRARAWSAHQSVAGAARSRRRAGASGCASDPDDSSQQPDEDDSPRRARHASVIRADGQPCRGSTQVGSDRCPDPRRSAQGAAPGYARSVRTTDGEDGSDGAAAPIRFGVVGSGWRAEFFVRMARLMPERFQCVGVVTRTAERGAEVERAWGVPTVRTIEELVTAVGPTTDRPEFVVVSVPWPVTPDATRELVELGIPVLAETPPAPDADGLRELWADVGSSGLVQVAEHSPSMPSHAARIAVVDAGLIGTPTSVQISSTHLYHAVGLIRRLLGRGPRRGHRAGLGRSPHRWSARWHATAGPARPSPSTRGTSWPRSTSATAAARCTTSPTTSGTTRCAPTGS